MSIYSANRTGSFNVAQIAANESYKWNDIGRILCESQANDMAFFEAALACDFTEVKGLHEGAIAKRDVELMNVENKKKFVEKLIERLKAFWAKLKGAIMSAINKIAELAVNNKQFLKHFDAKVTADALSKWKGSISGVVVYDLNHKCISMTDGDQFKIGLDSGITNDINVVLANALGTNDSDVTPKNYTAKALKACQSIEVLNADGVGEYKDIISKANDYIKHLKTIQKNTEASVNQAIRDLKKVTVVGDKDNNFTNQLTNGLQVTEIAVSTIVKAAITVTREDMKSRRVALRKVMDDIAKTDKEVHEAAVLDDMEEFEDTMNAGLPDEETKKEIDALVASVEA